MRECAHHLLRLVKLAYVTGVVEEQLALRRQRSRAIAAPGVIIYERGGRAERVRTS